MRARMALKAAGICCQLREVLLRDKPESMLEISPKGTVPVLQLEQQVLDESLSIMQWALRRNDPENWLAGSISDPLIKQNDGGFKRDLDHYKYFDRYPEQPQSVYFDRVCEFLGTLQQRLRESRFLSGDHPTVVDVAIFPFIRQCCMVDQQAFRDLQYEELQNWLEAWMNGELFKSVMHKYPLWQAGDAPAYFGGLVT
jgi:glutathione S-transferase